MGKKFGKTKLSCSHFIFFLNGQTRHKIQKSLKKILFHLDFRICMDGGYSLEQAQVVGIVGIVGMVGMVGIVGINK